MLNLILLINLKASYTQLHRVCKTNVLVLVSVDCIVLVYVGYMILAVFTRHLDEDMGFSLFF